MRLRNSCDASSYGDSVARLRFRCGFDLSARQTGGVRPPQLRDNARGNFGFASNAQPRRWNGRPVCGADERRLNFAVERDTSGDHKFYLGSAQHVAQDSVFERSNFRAPIGRNLKIELEFVFAVAFEFVLDEKGGFAVNRTNGSRVRHSERAVPGMRGA